MNQEQLIQWCLDVIVRESASELYGIVTFSFEKGRVVSCRTEKTEKPRLDASLR